MPTPTKGPRLGGSPAHERLMLANLATALFEHGKITTTEAKAKRLRPLAEQLITKAKRGDLHARRRVLDRDPRQGRRPRRCSTRSGRATRTAPAATPASPRSARARATTRPWRSSSWSRRSPRRSSPRPTAPPSGAAKEKAAKEAAAPPPLPTVERDEAVEPVEDDAAEARPPRRGDADERPTSRPRTTAEQPPRRPPTRPPPTRPRTRPDPHADSSRARRRPPGTRARASARPGSRLSRSAAPTRLSGCASTSPTTARTSPAGPCSPGLRTVQGERRGGPRAGAALPDPARSTVAGRTDAGVHARGQVAHVDVPAGCWAAAQREARCLRRLGGLAAAGRPRPRDRARRPTGFDARFSALWRRYAYRVCDQPGGRGPAAALARAGHTGGTAAARPRRA